MDKELFIILILIVFILGTTILTSYLAIKQFAESFRVCEGKPDNYTAMDNFEGKITCGELRNVTTMIADNEVAR